MGCSSSRVDKPCHEAALMAGDNSLLYASHEISVLFPALKAISKESLISKSDFRSFLKSSKLGNDEKIQKFYKSLQREKEFHLSTIATLATILCKGSVEDKVSVLFETWASNNLLDREKAFEILDCIFDLAVEYLPVLVAAPTTNCNYTPDELNHFLQRAKAGREKAKLDITNEMFLRDSVSAKEVSGWFNKNNNNTWLVSFGVRENLKDMGKKARREKKHKSTQDDNEAGNKSTQMGVKASQSLDVHVESHEINTAPISEVIEQHHQYHHHHEHHEGKVDASE